MKRMIFYSTLFVLLMSLLAGGTEGRADGLRGQAQAGPGLAMPSADGVWEWQAGREFRDVYFVDAYQGWAVGQGGILHTTDGGANWYLQASGAFLLSSVRFVDAYRGWVVGEYGLIAHTANGGANWYLQASGTGAWLASLHFVDAQNGWVVGQDGLILHTADGGSTWLPQVSGTEAWLASVHFVNVQSGWAVGDYGTILHTADGGTTWLPQVESEGPPSLSRPIVAGDDDTCVREETGDNRVHWEYVRLGKSMYNYVERLPLHRRGHPAGGKDHRRLSFLPSDWLVHRRSCLFHYLRGGDGRCGQFCRRPTPGAPEAAHAGGGAVDTVRGSHRLVRHAGPGSAHPGDCGAARLAGRECALAPGGQRRQQPIT
ncbi:MAG: YCF48-related protein [Anaerolineae bacterium]|nr:YCF48-related protein [Anaerolineae bacterium]